MFQCSISLRLTMIFTKIPNHATQSAVNTAVNVLSSFIIYHLPLTVVLISTITTSRSDSPSQSSLTVPCTESYQAPAGTLHEGLLPADGDHLDCPPGSVRGPVLPRLLPPVSQLRLQPEDQPVRLLRPPPGRDSVRQHQSGPAQPGHCGLPHQCESGGSQHRITASPPVYSCQFPLYGADDTR